MNRAYSLITVTKAIDDVANQRRIFSGMATTPELDRALDTIDPLGAKFTNPLSLLRNHDSDCPIGTVTFKKPTAKGIEFDAEIPTVAEPGDLKDRLDMAWGEIKAGLIRAVSVGFMPVKYAFMDNGGVDYQEIEIYELSTVAIPANASAIITTVKSIDHDLRQAAGVPEPTLPKNPNDKPPAASGRKATTVVRLTPPASGKSQPSKTPKEGQDMKTVSEQISALEAKRAATAGAMQALMQKSIESGETLGAEEQTSYDDQEGEIGAIDGQLKRLKSLEAILAGGAKAVRTVDTEAGVVTTIGTVSVKQQPKLEPGIALARFAKAKAVARLDGEPIMVIARKMYGPDSDLVGMITKANEVVPGSNASGNWGIDLISPEGAMFADFVAFLRPSTILGKFGVNGVPSLRNVGFYMPLISQTGGGTGYWVGEGKPKPLTSFDFDRTTLTPLKVANIAVLTEENIRYSTPSSDGIVRDALKEALVEVQDLAFIDPANAGTANVKPASITNGAAAVVSPGTDANDIRLGIRALFGKFIDANNPPQSGVWLMSASNALALSLLLNPLGQREFPNIGMNGGTFEGLPVIVSQHMGSVVALVNASDIYEADSGEINVDMSREASLEMSSAPTQNGIAGTGASLVSLWQNNLVGIRAEKTVNWKRRRASAVAYLTGAVWGGAVPAS